jgi:tyrosine aminotransferase
MNKSHLNNLLGFDFDSQLKDFPFEAQLHTDAKGYASENSISFPFPQNIAQESGSELFPVAFALLVAKHVNLNDIVVSYSPSENGNVVLPLRINFEKDDIDSVKQQIIDSNTDLSNLGACLEALSVTDRKCLNRFVVSISTPFGEMPTDVQDSSVLYLHVEKDVLKWNYDTELLGDSIELIHERFMKIIQDLLLVTKSGLPFEDLMTMSMIDSNEQSKLIELSRGAKRIVIDKSYGTMFEEQAMLVPHHLAVKDIQGGALSFGQLNEQAEKIAVQLDHRLMTYNPRIAVVMPRTIDLFVALIASAKVNGAYVPIDPSFPTERISYMIEDSSCDLILVAQEYAHLIPDSLKQSVVIYEQAVFDAYTKKRTTRTRAIQPFNPHDTMLVLYTSGTTGKPKGVAIEQRSAVYFIQNSYWDCVTDNDVFMQMANPCFIGSMNDICLPLVKGAASIIVPKESVMDIDNLNDTLKNHDINCCFFTPKVLEMIADVDVSLFDGLKLVQFAGEAVRLDAVEKIAGRVQHLQHLYGCTERMGCVSGHELLGTKDNEEADPRVSKHPRIGRLPIGHPIENTQCYILNKVGAPVPIGTSGELFVGGNKISQGYINREKITAEKFVHNPFDEGLMYSTGDLARWLPDGRGLDLIGRKDTLVKINGHRVELGEIEASIMAESEQLGIKAAAVIVTTSKGSKMISAYVAPATVDTILLKKTLQDKLPSFLLPKAIIAIDSIPLNSNGKLDHSKLSSPAEQMQKSDSEDNSNYRPARTKNEKVVVDVWGNLLGLKTEQVSIDSDFLKIGGHSLLVMKILGLLKVHCPPFQLGDLLECSTPKEIADRMDELQHETAVEDIDECIVKFSRKKEDVEGVLPVWVVHDGSGLIGWAGGFLPFMETRPLYGLQMTDNAYSTANKTHPDDMYTGVCEYYKEAIVKVQPHGPYKIAGNSMGALIAYEIAYQLEQEGEIVEEVISMDMPAVKLDMFKSYATAPSYNEKGNTLVAHVLGDYFCKDKEVFEREFAAYIEELDEAILGAQNDVDLKNIFLDLASTVEFLGKMGMPQQDLEAIGKNLETCNTLLVDIPSRGHKIKADIVCAFATDHRFISHSLHASGLDNMIKDYGWTQCTTGKVTMIPVFGNHTNFVSTNGGRETFGRVLDSRQYKHQPQSFRRRSSMLLQQRDSRISFDSAIGYGNESISVITDLQQRRRSSTIPVTKRSSILGMSNKMYAFLEEDMSSSSSLGKEMSSSSSSETSETSSKWESSTPIEASQKSHRTVNSIRAIVDPIASKIQTGDERGDGKDIISLALGDPTVNSALKPCPVAIQAIQEALLSDTTRGYVNACGKLEAREAIAKAHSTSNDVDGISSDNVIIASGCSGALEISLSALLEEGSILLVPQPGFPLYQVIAESNGASVQYYNLKPDKNWEIDFNSIRYLYKNYGGKIKGIVINNPANPTGAVFSYQHLLDFVTLCDELTLPIVADEIYGDLTFGENKFIPIIDVIASASASSSSANNITCNVINITVSGCGKQYLIPGWRVGWAVFYDNQYGSLRDVEAGAKRLAQVVLGASHLTQSAVPVLLDPNNVEIQQWKNELKSTLSNQASVLANALRGGTKQLEVLDAQGAMYVMCRLNVDEFDDSINNEIEFTELLLEEENVFVLPGSCFGVSNVVRLVFCAPAKTLTEAADRIISFCNNHQKSLTFIVA